MNTDLFGRSISPVMQMKQNRIIGRHSLECGPKVTYTRLALQQFERRRLRVPGALIVGMQPRSTARALPITKVTSEKIGRGGASERSDARLDSESAEPPQRGYERSLHEFFDLRSTS